MIELEGIDRDILAFAKRRYRNDGRRDEDIRIELGMTPTAYYVRLNQLLDSPVAALSEPQLVARLRAGRDRQQRLRSPRRVA